MKKTILITFSFLIISIPYTTSAKEYSLNELWWLALQRSETIKIAKENLYISEREKDKAKSVLWPTLSAFGEHKRFAEEKRPSGFLIQPKSIDSWGLRFDQSFSISGKELIAYRIAKDSIIKTRYDLDSVREDYLLNVATAYYDVLKFKKILEIAEATVERLKKHRDAAEVRLKVGEATKTVLLRAEAELASAQSDLIKAQNGLRLAKTVLARTVGISGDFDLQEEPVPDDNSAIDGCQVADLECFKQMALIERAEIKALKIENKIAKNKITHAKGDYWPTLSIEGVYSRQENHPSTTFQIKETMYAGIRLDFPFFEGGLTRAEVSEAKAELRQTELALLDLQKSINVEVERAYLDLITESSIMAELQSEVEYATENYNMVSKQFEYGLADSIDVIDANTLLVTSKRDLSNAKYNYQLAVLKLKRTVGTLLKTVLNKGTGKIE